MFENFYFKRFYGFIYKPKAVIITLKKVEEIKFVGVIKDNIFKFNKGVNFNCKKKLFVVRYYLTCYTILFCTQISLKSRRNVNPLNSKPNQLQFKYAERI